MSTMTGAAVSLERPSGAAEHPWRVGAVTGLPLTALPAGATATVVGFEGTQTAALPKLLALGVVPGVEVCLERQGAVVVFRLGYTRFAVDRDLASTVLVQREAR